MPEPETNRLGQPVGWPVPGWTARPLPPRTAMAGRFSSVLPLDPERHAAELFAAYRDDREGQLWTYLPRGPYASLDEFRAYADAADTEDALDRLRLAVEGRCPVHLHAELLENAVGLVLAHLETEAVLNAA